MRQMVVHLRSVGLGCQKSLYPSDVEGWANGLSLVKELTFTTGNYFNIQFLKQVSSIRYYFIKWLPFPTAFELEVDIPKNEICFYSAFSERNGFKRTLITIDTIHGKITLDRTFAGQSFAEKYGTIRETKIRKNKSVQLTIFVDCSVAEIYK